MSAYTLDNPVFLTYLLAASLMVLKVMGQGWMTVVRMMKSNSGFASPEDTRQGLFNPNPSPSQTDLNDYVDRSRRMHRNDLENVLPFLSAGLLFVAVEPSLILAQILMFGFVITRAAHAVAYASARSHETRATFYTIGSLIVIYMALHVAFVSAKGLF